MSLIYDFFPMKKRKVSTPNGSTRRSASTLGKLNQPSDSFLPDNSENAIEILWDNNSPSPTTTIALAGKRRRRQYGAKREETAITDVSFVVQKLSRCENTSPVVDEGQSDLLEVWIDKINENKNHNMFDEDFKSPPFPRTRHKKITTPRSTPLIKRTTRGQTRKNKQVMMEIRKLVDEIQKSDSSSSQSQLKSTEEQTPLSNKSYKPCSAKLASTNSESVTAIFEPTTRVPEPITTVSEPITNISGPSTKISDRLMDDSFDWTEDDMDELILTCQLSSSGKGSLTISDAPRPQCGLSPSEIILVPETQFTQISDESPAKTATTEKVEFSSQGSQLLFPLEGPESNISQATEPAQEVPGPKQTEDWELNFDDDDSLLASAAQAFELSQESMTRKEIKCENLSLTTSTKSSSSFTNFTKISSSTKDDDNYNSIKERSSLKNPHKIDLKTTRNSSHSSHYRNECISKSPKKENRNSKSSHNERKLKEATKLNLSTTRSSIHSNKLTKQYNSRNHDENSRKTSPSGKNDCKKIMENTKNFNCKQEGKILTTKTNTKCLVKEQASDVSSDRYMTPLDGIRTILTLKRTTSNENKTDRSLENATNSSENQRKGSSSPLKTIPGNVCPEKTFRPQMKLEISKQACSKQTAAKNFSSAKDVVKGSKPHFVENSRLLASEKHRKSIEVENDLIENKKDGENELDFLLCEDNFIALLDDFNFDDVLTETSTPAPVKTSTNFTSTTTITKNWASTVSQKKYTQDEIERKRLEAQRRRLAKAKNKTSTQLNHVRISKR